MASSSRSRKCKNKANAFYYICGVYTFPCQRRNTSLFVKRAFKHIFKFLLVIKTKNGLPTLCATTVKKCFATGRKESERAELNDLVRDLDLSKQAAKILASRLNEKHVLHSSAKVSFLKKR